MADSIKLQIVTPEGIKLTADVSQLTAPSVDGEFGVLPGHRPLLAALRTGIVSYSVGGVERRVAVGAGFVEVASDVARLLTDNFMTKEEVDPVRARLELKEADQALDNYGGDPKEAAYSELVRRELWAATQLELYGDPPPPTIRSMEHEFVASTENYRNLAGDPDAPEV